MVKLKMVLMLGLMTVGAGLVMVPPASADVGVCAQALLDVLPGTHVCFPDTPSHDKGCYIEEYDAFTRTGVLVEVC